jgi:hypothetical protein
MPLLQTRGAGSARGFGFSATQASGPPPCDGTKAIFTLGQTGCTRTNTRNKYTYATCTSSAAASATFNGSNGAAAGNSTQGIIARGDGSSRIDKYTYSSCTSASTTDSCSGMQYGTAAGNSTRGIFGAGIPGPVRYKRTYATNVWSAGACPTAGGFYISAVGNSTRGIFTYGTNTNTRDKYTYATDTSTASGVALACRSSYGGTAAGNSTRGIFNLGNAGGGGTTCVYRNKYVYATCTSINSTCLPAPAAPNYAGSGTGNSTRGIFALGYSGGACAQVTTRCKYTYATDTSTASGVGVASAAAALGSAVSWATGVNV